MSEARIQHAWSQIQAFSKQIMDQATRVDQATPDFQLRVAKYIKENLVGPIDEQLAFIQDHFDEQIIQGGR